MKNVADISGIKNRLGETLLCNQQCGSGEGFMASAGTSMLMLLGLSVLLSLRSKAPGDWS